MEVKDREGNDYKISLIDIEKVEKLSVCKYSLDVVEMVRFSLDRKC